MATIDLLRLHLKDPEIIDLLEITQSEVIYDFDRCNEGSPDSYHVCIPEQNLELIFNSAQQLTTIFIDFSVTESSDFETDDGFPIFRSITEAIIRVHKIGAPYHQGVTNILGPKVQWLRVDFPDHSVHYEYGSRGLQKVTLMTSEIVPKKQ